MSTTARTEQQHELEVAQHFDKDTARHQLAVARNDGVYRHLIAQRSDSLEYWFEITTWPGGLTIHGDMGTWTFSRHRNEDPFTMFRQPGGGINPYYWSQKAVSVDRNASVYEYSQEQFTEDVNDLAREHVKELLEDDSNGTTEVEEFLAAIREDVLSCGSTEHEARNVLETFEHKGFEFTDSYEWRLGWYSFRLLWAMHAIVWAVARFDETHGTGNVPHVEPESSEIKLTAEGVRQVETVSTGGLL